MRYLLLGVLVLLLIAAAVLTLAVWHRWELHLHLKNRHLTLTLRGFGIKRRILDKDFSQKEEPQKRETASGKEYQKEKKENRFRAKLEADKKRIYDKEKGGYQHSGLMAVIQEYREMWRELTDTFRGVFGDMRHKVEICQTEIRLNFGTGNPAHTGMAYSAVWSIVGIFYPLFCRQFQMEYPSMAVTPDFYEKRFDLEIKSIIMVRPAHIIHAALKQGWRMAVTYLKENIKSDKKGSGKNE